jgi:transaldolase
LKEWAERELPIPEDNYVYTQGNLKGIPFREIELTKNWQEYNIHHELTDKGIVQFSADWNALIK